MARPSTLSFFTFLKISPFKQNPVLRAGFCFWRIFKRLELSKKANTTGLQFVEKDDIAINSTILVIGQATKILLPSGCVSEASYLAIEKADKSPVKYPHPELPEEYDNNHRIVSNPVRNIPLTFPFRSAAS